jgi:chromosome segregation ATPase
MLAVVGLGLAAIAVVPRPAAAEPETKAPLKRELKAPPRGSDLAQEVATLLEGQRSLAATLAQLREQLDAMQRGLGGAQDEIRESRDLLQAAMEQIKGMREEVRGLYVESSGLKGDIAQLGKQVEGLEGNLGSFRLNSGILLAVVLVLQFTLVALMFRGRGQ